MFLLHAEPLDMNGSNIRFRCTDCGTVYWVRARKITGSEGNGSAHEISEEDDFRAKKRKAKEDARAQIKPALAPKLGFNTVVLDQVIAAGPAGLRRAQRTALRSAKRYLEEAADSWKLETEWLKSFDAVHRARAMHLCGGRDSWRLSRCVIHRNSARYTRISCQMAYYHRKHDPQFAKQWDEAPGIRN